MSLGKGLVSIIMQGMVIYMNEQQLQTLEQLQAFLDGTVAIDLQLAATERYACISRTLRRFCTRCLNKNVTAPGCCLI
jgi:hypothetical protein